MHSLRIRKFFLDHLIGAGLIIALSYVLIGNFTIMDTRGVLTLAEACSSSSLPQDILDSVQLVLRNDEYCEIVEPCEQFRSLRCSGTAKVSDVPMHVFAQDLLIKRVQRHLMKQYGFAGYSDKSTFRVSGSLFPFFLVYAFVLLEAGAMMFALWRQKLIRQTFSLPIGPTKDQLFKPMLFGVFLALAILAIGYQVDRLFGYPDIEQTRANLAVYKTTSGIVMAILAAPFAEELIFRGVLLRFFLERKRRLLGIIFISVLFSVLHGFSEETIGWQLYKSSTYFLLSVIFCWSYIKQKNLWSPIILHGGYNATMVGFLNVFA